MFSLLDDGGDESCSLTSIQQSFSYTGQTHFINAHSTMIEYISMRMRDDE